MSEHPNPTDRHDDPTRYGCHPRHYLAPQVPDGWRLVATYSPHEPSGWWGACRVILAERGTGYATALVNPSGHIFAGRYDLDPLPAWDDFHARSMSEDIRANHYNAGREVIA